MEDTKAEPKAIADEVAKLSSEIFVESGKYSFWCAFGPSFCSCFGSWNSLINSGEL